MLQVGDTGLLDTELCRVKTLRNNPCMVTMHTSKMHDTTHSDRLSSPAADSLVAWHGTDCFGQAEPDTVSGACIILACKESVCIDCKDCKLSQVRRIIACLQSEHKLYNVVTARQALQSDHM